MGVGKMMVAEVVDGGDAGTAPAEGNHVGGRKKEIGRVLVQLARKAAVRPKAAGGQHALLHVGCWLKQVGGWGLVEVEA